MLGNTREGEATPWLNTPPCAATPDWNPQADSAGSDGRKSLVWRENHFAGE